MSRVAPPVIALSILLLLLLVFAAGSPGAGVNAQEGEAPSPTPSAEPDGVEDIQVLPSQGKIMPPRYDGLDSNLNHVVKKAEIRRLVRYWNTLTGGGLGLRDGDAVEPLNGGSTVAVTLYIAEGYFDSVEAHLKAHGVTIRNSGLDFIEANIPELLLVGISRLEGVESVRTNIPPRVGQGTIVSGGVAAHGVPPWHVAGHRGSGVKVGVIDTGFKGFARLMGSELPSRVNARCYTGSGAFTSNLNRCFPSNSTESTKKHGTAVTEALFDVAPEAEYYISRPTSWGDVLSTVNWMVSQGVDVINMSLAWSFEGPGDGTSYYSNGILNSIDKAVQGGITWVNVAGNAGGHMWYGEFADSDQDGLHQFNSAGDECNSVNVRLDYHTSFLVQMRWDDTWGGADTDLDLYLVPYSSSGLSLSNAIASSESDQDGGSNDIPFEMIHRRYGQIADGRYCIVVKKTSGDSPSWIQILKWGGSGNLERSVLSHSIANPGEGRNSGMLAVGASELGRTNTIESFSGRGPTMDGRTKPDIVGADGGTSSTYGQWYGTSQASPHVAGLAALVKQRFPGYTPQQVANFLRDNASPRGTVPNNTWGHGFAELPSFPTLLDSSVRVWLTSLKLSDIDFGMFLPGLYSYNAHVANSATGTTVTPILNDPDASYTIKLGGVEDTDGAVSLAVGKNVITVEVAPEGGSTTQTYTVTVWRAATAGPLAHSKRVPWSHNGSSQFKFQLYFSEEVVLSYRDFTGALFESTGGTVHWGRRMVDGSNKDWEVYARPNGNGPVIITLPGGRACDVSGAVCTSAGQQLVNTLKVSIPGPAPSVTSPSTFTVPENTTLVGTLAAKDANTSTADLTWSIPSGAAGGADAAKFTLTTGGTLSFAEAKDFENPDDANGDGSYRVTVQVSDGTNTAKVDLTVTLSNVNEAPTANAGDDQENIETGTTVTLSGSGTDPDAGDTVTYAWSQTQGDGVTLSNPSSETTTFTAPTGLASELTLKFTLRATDTGGLYHEDEVSVTLSEVVNNSPATGAPTITGMAQVGETLAASTSEIADADGITNATFSYQWVHNDGTTDTDISGATGSTYTLVDADADKTIKVRVSFTDDRGSAEVLTSTAAAIWTGTLTVGKGASGGVEYLGYTMLGRGFSGGALSSPSHFKLEERYRTIHLILHSPGGLYFGVSTELGTDFILQIDESSYSSRDATYFKTDRSNIHNWSDASVNWSKGQILPVALYLAEPVPEADTQGAVESNSGATGAPTISGTAQVGETLTASTSGIADIDGVTNATFTYQWVRNDGTADTDISGATASTYTLVDADEGKTVKVKVSFTDDAGNAESLTSAATGTVVARANTAATGAPAITGTAQVGETLTASTSGIADTDGITNATFSYQWVRNDGTTDTDISGATASAYTLVDADEGETVKVKVSFTDDAGNAESLTSAATASVQARPNSPATGSPVITGTAQVGETLTVSTTGIADTDGIANATFSYQWVRGDGTTDADISGATSSTYTLVDADEGKTVKVRVTFTDDNGNAESLTSATTASVQAGAANSPATGAPTISGTAQVGETLTASTSGIADTDGITNATFSYQWVRNDGTTDTDISGATASTYTLADADEGKTVKVKVSFTDDAGNNESLTSAATASVQARPNSPASGAPTITGTAQVGETLTASTLDIADTDGITNATFSYQWVRNDGTTDTDISGATGSTYALADADEGKTIKVSVSFTDDRGNTEALTSAATASVQARPNSPATGSPAITGTARVGETLTASTSGIADTDGITNATFSYQWVHNDGTTDTDISGATASTYTLADADEGKTVKVKVSFTDDRGNAEVVTSAATGAIEAAEEVPPIWSVTMTVQDFGRGDMGALSASQFSNESGEFRISRLWYSGSRRELNLVFEEHIAVYENLTLYLGDDALAFQDRKGDFSFIFKDVDISWTDGQTVNVSITRQD